MLVTTECFRTNSKFTNYTVLHTFMQFQSHYREVTRWEIFMEQELRFEGMSATVAMLVKAQRQMRVTKGRF